jgi:hypothetical protein
MTLRIVTRFGKDWKGADWAQINPSPRCCGLPAIVQTDFWSIEKTQKTLFQISKKLQNLQSEAIVRAAILQKRILFARRTKVT